MTDNNTGVASAMVLRSGLMLLLLLLAAGAAVGVSTPALAQVDAFQFDTDEQERRFRRLSNELRCPMCQNTNLTGSTGGVAEDLRREIHRMIMEGMTDEQIEQFMFERYGDFIFYRPRLRAETLLLWFGPLIFLLIGGAVLYRIVRTAGGGTRPGLDEAEKKKLEELLRDR